MSNILITGVAGNIGSGLAAAMCRQGQHFVTGVDNLSTGAKEKVEGNNPKYFRFIKADCNDEREMAAIFLRYGFDYVFHFAAVVGVERTIQNPLLVLKDIEGIKNILNLSKNCGVGRVFYSSSSEVYGEPVKTPQHEVTTPLNSRLPYAIVKNLGEAYLKTYHKEYGLEYTIFRFFNTYGPNQSEDFVVPRFLTAAMCGDPIKIYGEGKQTRTFCYIDDNIDTMIRCLESDLFVNDVLNVGSEEETSIVDLAKLVIGITESKSIITYLPALKEGDNQRRCPDISKMKQVLNRPLITVEEGIMKLAECRLNSAKQ